MPTRVLVPSGVLGLGFDETALWRGIEARPDIIAIDGGSTDSGPFYLGTGTSKYARDICKSEWRILMEARERANIPLVIGSSGTCGTSSTVDWMYELTVELASELGQSVTITRLYCDQDQRHIARMFENGFIKPLFPAPELNGDNIIDCTNIVALAGVEQIQAALSSGADIVLAGRTTDTATIAALPIARGEHAGSAWHGAKIGECGAFCTTNPASGVILLHFDETGCNIEPMARDAACTPHSVSAHMLYENSDPFILAEPGGHLDVTAARYTALDHRSVRIEGGEWVRSGTYTVKLEAARISGFQTTMLAVIRDPKYVSKVEDWLNSLEIFLRDKIKESTSLDTNDYDLEFRLIGINAALGDLETRQNIPTEVGVLLIITAAEQHIATDLSKLINPYLLHYPLTKDEDLPTFTFPYSPAHTERGALYEFSMNHVLILEDPMDGFNLKTDRIDHAELG